LRYFSWLTDELYRDFRSQPPDGANSWSTLLKNGGRGSGTPHGVRAIMGKMDHLQI